MLKKFVHKYTMLGTGVKAGLWFTFCNLIQKGINFLVVPIFTRVMPQADFGIYSTYTSWYSFLFIFTSLRLSLYVFNKGMVKYEDDRDEFVVSLQSLSSVITLVVFVLYFVFRDVANRLLGLTTSLMVCMFVQMLFEPSIDYWSARKRFEYDYRKLVIVTVGIAFLNPILGLIMVLSSEDAVLARALSSSIVVFIFGIILYFLILKRSNKIFSTKYWKYALAFNIPLIPHFLSTTALSQADRIMISQLVGPESTAIYSVAYSLGMITLLFSQAIHLALLPWQYTKLKQGNYDRMPEVATITMIVVAAIIVAFIAFAPEVVHIVAPASYNEAVWAMPPVCSAVFFMYLFNLFANIEYYFEETKYVAIASIFAAIVNIGLNWVFIPVYGYVAAGYTTLFCYILLAISHYICMKRICKKHNFTEKVFDNKSIIYVSFGMVGILSIMMTVYRIVVMRYIIIFVIFAIALFYKEKVKSAFSIMRSNNK